MPRTENRNLRPNLQILSRVKSNVHMCNEAVLIRLKNGKNSLRYIANDREDYHVLLNNVPLCYAGIPSCGTCADMVRRGYGIENLNVDELSRMRDGINGEYPGIERAVQNIELLVGLLEDGLYLIADYEMYPTLGGRSHFWNGDYMESSMLHRLYAYNCRIAEVYDSPAYLFPSQSPKQLNEDTLIRYIDRLTEESRFPRAIAYYLNGCVSLLLDGHHKAAAAAHLGQTVKCLVIFHVEDTNGLMKQTDGQRLFLNPRPKIGGSEKVPYMWRGELILCGKNGTEYGNVRSIDRTKNTPEGREVTVACSNGKWYIDREEWGEVPDIYCRNMHKYPECSEFSQATLIPRNKILEEYSMLMENSAPESNWWRRRCLISYYEVFPQQKWITASMYERLKRMEEDSHHSWILQR